VAGVGPVSRADWLAINARGQRSVVVLAERGDACAERGARAHAALHERTGATDAAWRAAAVITSSISRRAGRSPHAVALWGVLTGEAPDEVPIDISEQRDVLIVGLVNASDPDVVREHQAMWCAK